MLCYWAQTGRVCDCKHSPSALQYRLRAKIFFYIKTVLFHQYHFFHFSLFGEFREEIRFLDHSEVSSSYIVLKQRFSAGGDVSIGQFCLCRVVGFFRRSSIPQNKQKGSCSLCCVSEPRSEVEKKEDCFSENHVDTDWRTDVSWSNSTEKKKKVWTCWYFYLTKKTMFSFVFCLSAYLERLGNTEDIRISKLWTSVILELQGSVAVHCYFHWN